MLRQLTIWAAALGTGAIATTLPQGLNRRAPSSQCKLNRTNADFNVGFPKQDWTVPSIGTAKALLIFVDFPEAKATDTTASLYNLLVTETPGLATWFNSASYGKFALDVIAETSTVAGAGFLTMPQPQSSYQYNTGLTYANHLRYIQDAIKAYVAAKGSMPRYDIIFVAPTINAKNITNSATLGSSVKAPNGTVVGTRATTFGQWARDWGSGTKVLAHETGHTLGLPDLYPRSSVGGTTFYVGGWDLMGLVSAQSPDYFAWHKWYLGWLTDSQIACVAGETGSHSAVIAPIETAGASDTKAFVYRKPGSNTQVLVAEVRGKAGLDASGCSQGVLLYTVDVGVATMEGPIRVLDAVAGNGCQNDPLNNVLQVGGSYKVPNWGVTVKVTGQIGASYNVTFES